MDFGYASFIDVGYGELDIGGQNAAFGQFYGKKPGSKFDPFDFESGALRIGDAKSHYPNGSVVFAGDELGGDYFIKVGGENTGVYWMIYAPERNSVFVCESFDSFLSRIRLTPYDDE